MLGAVWKEVPCGTGMGWAGADTGAGSLRISVNRSESRVQNLIKCSEIGVLWADGCI